MNDVVTRKPSPLVELKDQLDKRAGQFAAALPAHIPVERFQRVVMTAVQQNPDLINTKRQTFFNACMRAAQDGLLPDGREGAIVPYKGDAQWMPMIGGIRKKARNSGEIATWDVAAVYENDDFDYALGDNPFISHKPTLGEKGKLIAVYSVATLKSGEKSRDVMSVEDVNKIKALSRGSNTPWNNPTFFPEMAKKTVARRHSKVLPMSSDLDDLIRRDDSLYEFDKAKGRSFTPLPNPTSDDAPARITDERPAQDDHDPETGEVIDGTVNDVQDGAATGGDAPATDQGTPEATKAAPAGDTATTIDVGGVDPELLEAAEAHAREAARTGRPKRVVPAKYQEPPALRAAWDRSYEKSAADKGDAQ